MMAQAPLAYGGLERPALSAYHLPMDDMPRTKLPDDWEPPMPSRDELLRMLAESEAEAEAGLLVSGNKVIRELYDAAAQLEASLAAPEESGPTPGR